MPNMESLKTDGHYTLARKIFSKIKNWVENKVQTDVPVNAVFTDYKSNVDLYMNSQYSNQTLSKLRFDSTDFEGSMSSVGTTVNGTVSLKHHVGIDVPANAVFTDTTYSDATTSASGLMSAEDKTLVSTGISDAYDNTSTYAVGDIVIYNGSLYICKTAITTAEDFDSSKWDATNLGDEIENIYSEINPLVDKIYPVGSIYISVTNTNPGTLFGGTWHAFGAGRTLIGMGSNGTTNYTTVKHTGGAETVNLQHSHTVESHTHSLSSGYALVGRCADNLNSISYRKASSGSGTYTRLLGGGMGISSISKASTDVTALGGDTGGATPDTNNKLSTKQSIMQPYITVYMWERTA